ncbi:ABC transporter ATP-binding protein [Microcystis aeruginosa]|uniref:ABC transporter, ATP-binding protein n=1 Tax=Microcystis aeruginosa PCC 9808 TaxID=1160284 RepID=I4HPJ4_MICAE|nr:ATP-binding cassette domain-containing protein [Microcystis aeruginosa]CCI23968.1 ABC transporter, ATP-binding protein [Microcystis aeruginosa PCC 9808]
MSNSTIDIKVKNLSVKFQKNSKSFFALDGVDFEVKRGEFFCIVGPSGCGKSTLLKTLLGFLQPTTGEVDISEERKKAGMVYLPQSPSLLPWRTLLQNAALGLEIKGKLNKDRQDTLKFDISKFGLGDFEKHLSTEISGGMKQKVELIRALASKPQLLFCDEPFASIDFVNRFELNTEFKYRCSIAGTTTVFVTHNIEEAIFLGNKIAVMSQRPGQIMKIYEPKLSKNAHDAIKCRESPEFEDLFQKIWENLKGNYE